MEVQCLEVTFDAGLHTFPCHIRAAHTDFCALVLTSQKGVNVSCALGESMFQSAQLEAVPALCSGSRGLQHMGSHKK